MQPDPAVGPSVPDRTFALGVLPALILLTLPALILIIHAIITRRWQLDGWQKLYLAAIRHGFSGGGVIISVKIGAAATCTTWIVFLITVALTAGLMLEAPGKGWIDPSRHAAALASRSPADPRCCILPRSTGSRSKTGLARPERH